MTKTAIISNPHAKMNKLNPNRQKSLISLVKHFDSEISVYTTQNLQKLQDSCTEIFNNNINTIIINGGDGTISQTITYLVKQYCDYKEIPDILIIGGGTINVLKKNLKLKGSAEKIIRKYYTSNLRQSKIIPTLKVYDNYGFLFANLTSATFLKKYYTNKTNSFGAAIWILKVILSQIFRTDLYKDIVIDDIQKFKFPENTITEHKTISVFCSTLKKLPMGYPLFTKLKKPLTQFQVFSFAFKSSQSFWRLPYILLTPFMKNNRDRVTFLTKNLVLTSTSNKSNYTLDGELFNTNDSSIELSLGPKLNFITL